DSVRRPVAGYDSAQRKTFDPNLSVGNPEPDFNFRPGLDRARGFDQTSGDAGVGKVTPDWTRVFVDTKFDRHKALDSRVAPAIAAPVGAEQIGFKRRCGRRRS